MKGDTLTCRSTHTCLCALTEIISEYCLVFLSFKLKRVFLPFQVLFFLGRIYEAFMEPEYISSEKSAVFNQSQRFIRNPDFPTPQVLTALASKVYKVNEKYTQQIPYVPSCNNCQNTFPVCLFPNYKTVNLYLIV